MVAKVTAPSGTPQALNRQQVAPVTTVLEHASQTVYQDDLLSYVVYLTQEKFKPNKDEGVTFYYGMITNIIDGDNTTYDKRDIFYSRVDGIERINNTSTKDQSTRKIYFVHIPALYSVLFSNELSVEKKNLTAEDFYKFRIENTVNLDNLSVGNIVKVRFENNSTFQNGVIEQKVDDGILSLKLPPNQNLQPKKEYENIEKCIVNPIADSSGQARALFVATLTKNEVISVGLFDFLEFFTSDRIKAEQDKVSISQNIKYIIKGSPTTIEEIKKFRSINKNFNAVPLSEQQGSKFFITPDSNIKDDANNNIYYLNIEVNAGSFSKTLAEYLSTLLSANYYLTTKVEDSNVIKITFKIDTISKDKFYIFSQGRYITLKEFNISPASVQFTQQQIKNVEQPKPNQLGQECNKIIDADLYIDISKDEWKRRGDQVLVDYFFGAAQQINSSDPQLKKYGNYNILNSYAIAALSYTAEEIVKSNKEVYINSNELIEQNPLSGKQSRISVKKIESNLDALRGDMEILKRYICTNEGLDDQSVLVLPFKWFETKPVPKKIPNNRDESSQLWFGRSVQFVVYVRINDKIYQIPPEIVFLYVYKALSDDGQRQLGIGVFTSKGFYTQYENLNGIRILDPEPRYWSIPEDANDLERQLNSVSANDFLKTIREYVRTKYANEIFGTPQKIRNLL